MPLVVIPDGCRGYRGILMQVSSAGSPSAERWGQTSVWFLPRWSGFNVARLRPSWPRPSPATPPNNPPPNRQSECLWAAQGCLHLRPDAHAAPGSLIHFNGSRLSELRFSYTQTCIHMDERVNEGTTHTYHLTDNVACQRSSWSSLI